MRPRSRSLDFSPRSMATKWSLSGCSRTWLPSDSPRIRKVSRSNETKLIQSHYRELTAFRTVTAHQNLLSSDYESHEQRQTKRRYSDRERKRDRGSWKFFPATITTLDLLDGQRGSKRFMSQFASIYLPGRQTFREGASSHLPLCAVLLLVSPLLTCQRLRAVRTVNMSCILGLKAGLKFYLSNFSI